MSRSRVPLWLVTIALGAAISFAGWVATSIYADSNRITRVETRTEGLKESVDSVERKVDRIDRKLDRLIERR
jgi:hypothetical protein